MKRLVFSREFKVEAVKLIRERGVAVAQAARDLDVAQSVLRHGAREGGADPLQAFPGHGQVKSEQRELTQLRREVARLKAERDILKKSRGLLCQGVDMKFGFVAKHRGVWPVRWLCEALGVSRNGFHAWLSRPPSARAVADEALTARVRASFVASAEPMVPGACGMTCWLDMNGEIGWIGDSRLPGTNPCNRPLRSWARRSKT